MYFFNEPAKPFMSFTYYDIAFLILIVIINIYIFRNRKSIKINHLTKISTFLLFFILIPYLSNTIETRNIYKKFTIVDGFNLWYLIFKYPVWWSIGVLEILFLSNLQEKKSTNSTA
ncbi:hypothetical protein IX39_13215 [Chryseobacterium formosense]|uniref:Uncharacterized protein n=1 Tax=Chryseobacterium formosense TaxID=236814 RepID=A0A085Z1T4_9FLAO|nr:hypothetical protein IX39_13215 [Chryseobacterium formosense]SFT87264.1 hypothetical protein SAMN05421857_3836 [Chryseobacterium formosense]